MVEWVLIGGLAMQDKLHEIRVFENFKEELFETGHVIVTTEVVEKSLNYFGIMLMVVIYLRSVIRWQDLWHFQQETTL